MESETKNRKTQEQVARMVEGALGETTLAPVGPLGCLGPKFLCEGRRCHLYTLHLGLVMKTECYYRNYDTDFVSTLGLQLIASSLKWLREN